MTMSNMARQTYASRATQGRPATKRGRPGIEDWQNRARFVLRHLGDPFALQESPLARQPALEQIAETKYQRSILPAGRAIHDLALVCLQEIHDELGDHAAVSRLRAFVELTRQGMGVTQASRKLGITPEYASRALKRRLVELLADKLSAKLR